MMREQHHGPGQRHDRGHHVTGGRSADLPSYPETEEDSGGGPGCGEASGKRRWLPMLAIAIAIAFVVLIVLEHALGLRVFGVH
jgi:hypothetical protein